MISRAFLLTCLVVVLMPGTGVLYTVSTALFKGRHASLYAACGCTLGILPSLLASITGLAILFHTSALLFQTVKYLGVAYLLFLAWSMLRAGGPLALQPQSTSQAGLRITSYNVCYTKLLRGYPEIQRHPDRRPRHPEPGGSPGLRQRPGSAAGQARISPSARRQRNNFV